jgi:glycosyltransferase involved in cell wall biosynthesis
VSSATDSLPQPLSVVVAGTSFGFPYGQGAASRAYWYAKALQSAGAKVRVVTLLKPREGSEESTEPACGTYEGIEYEYACGTRVRPRSFLLRRLLGLRLIVRVQAIVRTLSREAPGHSAVLIYSESSLWIAVLAVTCRLNHVVSVLDLCEYPLVGRLGSARASLARELRRRIVYPRLDGIIPISSFLEKYVLGSRRPPPTLVVPVMVDTAMFTPGHERTATEHTRVVYCGALGRLDEVTRAICAFAQATDGLDEAELVIVGDGPIDRVKQAESLVRALGMNGRVRFTGAVRREDLPEVLRSADVFVLPRAPGVFSTAGLPNKLGEYLATGRPVVVNANGDIPHYVTDGVSAFLVDPHDEAQFAATLRRALVDRAEAAGVGVRGRDAAVEHFDFRRQGVRLAAFLATLTTIPQER